MSLPHCLTSRTLRFTRTKHGMVVAERVKPARPVRYALWIAGLLIGHVQKKNSRHWDSYRPDGSLMHGEVQCTRKRAIERLQELQS